MFDYLLGILITATPHKAVVETGGIGYKLFISIATFQKLPSLKENVKLFVSTVIREDSQKMYGFLSEDERDFFEKLNDISGIGPRLSIAILGHLPMEELHLAVEKADVKGISKVPGIGKKMAERLIIELRDKFKTPSKGVFASQVSHHQGVTGDAISALTNLGYSLSDAQRAINQVVGDEEPPPLPELISLALKGKNR